jgi:cellulose synthase (UDP-forming)
MNAQVMLRLWRERWGRAEEGVPRKPFAMGKVYDFFMKVPTSSLWEIPGASSFIVLFTVLLLTFSTNTGFSINGQITFAGLMLASAYFFSRYAGSFFSLGLVYLSLLCLGQYFAWRLSGTLSDQVGLSFIWAFLVCAAELAVAFYFVVGWTNRLVALEQSEVALTLARDDRPEIDVFLIVGDTSDPTVITAIQACADCAWSDKPLNLVVITKDQRTSVAAETARREGIYLCLDSQIASESSASTATTALDAVALGLRSTSADYIVVLELNEQLQASTVASIISERYLLATLGWMSRDQGLNLIYSEGHLLAPTVSKLHFQPRLNRSLPAAILRRSAWQEADEDALQSLWDSSALMIERNADANHVPDSEQNDNEAAFIRIDQAHRKFTMFVKMKLLRLESLLRFYAPVVYGIFLTAPLALLVFGIHLVKGKPSWFAAFALPVLAMMYFTHTRISNLRRRGSWAEVCELALAAYFLVATSFTFVKTTLSNPKHLFLRLMGLGTKRQLAKDMVFYGLIAFNGVAILSGILRIIYVSGDLQFWVLGYMAWALVNVLLLLCHQAVSFEVGHIQSFAKQQQRLPAMIRLAFGRTLSCETLNYPQNPLAIRMPVASDLKVGDQTKLSVFSRDKGYVLPVRIERLTENIAYVSFNQDSIDMQKSLKDSVFSRGDDWPKWIPDRNADRPLPDWCYGFVASLPSKLIELTMNMTKIFQWGALRELWKKRT